MFNRVFDILLLNLKHALSEYGHYIVHQVLTEGSALLLIRFIGSNVVRTPTCIKPQFPLSLTSRVLTSDSDTPGAGDTLSSSPAACSGAAAAI
jgi:hypothetical protein